MNSHDKPDIEFDKRIAARLLDVLIRAGLIFAMVALCYRVFSPFLHLMVWALILAVTLYPVHQSVADSLGGRQGLSAALLVVLCIALIVAPTAVLMSSLGDSVHQVIRGVQENSFEIPAPRDSVANWPVVGRKLHAIWSQAHADLPALVESMQPKVGDLVHRFVNAVQQHTLQIPPPRPGVASWPIVGEKIDTLWRSAYTDLPALVQSLQPKIGDLAKSGLAMVASIGGAILQFVAAFVIAGIVMAFGQAGGRGSLAIFERVAGEARGAELASLSAATIRAVAQGVIGVAFIQAIIIGLCLLVAGVPWAGVLAVVVLVLGIAQVPALLVTLPAIAYLWVSGNYGNAEAAAYSVLLFVSGMADNVLKPLMLGRGVDAPMPLILLGALGGMATAGILGMFVGATLLALGYQIFMGWVAESSPDRPPASDDGPGRPPEPTLAAAG